MQLKLVYPLDWPESTPRSAHRRVNNQFKTSLDKAQSKLLRELGTMGAKDVVLSCNLKPRQRGEGFIAGGIANVSDPGVAVYFKRGDKDFVFAADSFHHIQDNVNAIALTINALRGIERWGASDMMERAFSGFKALPVKASTPWRDVLRAGNCTTFGEVQQAYRIRVKETHPDYGGNVEDYQRVCDAWKDAQRELTQ